MITKVDVFLSPLFVLSSIHKARNQLESSIPHPPCIRLLYLVCNLRHGLPLQAGDGSAHEAVAHLRLFIHSVVHPDFASLLTHRGSRTASHCPLPCSIRLQYRVGYYGAVGNRPDGSKLPLFGYSSLLTLCRTFVMPTVYRDNRLQLLWRSPGGCGPTMQLDLD